jgi:hypothetical protein
MPMLLALVSILMLVAHCDQKSAIQINQQQGDWAKAAAAHERLPLRDEVTRCLSSWSTCFPNYTNVVGGAGNVVVVRLGAQQYSGPSTIVSIDITSGNVVGRLELPSLYFGLWFGVSRGGSSPMFLLFGSNNMTAWSLPDLRPAWFLETGPYRIPSVTYSSSHSLFCAVLLKNVYEYPACFDAAKGTMLWTNLNNESMAPLNGIFLLSRDILICDQTTNQYLVYGLNATTGQWLWGSSTLGLSAYPWPALDGILILEPGGSNGLIAVTMSTGAPLWNNSAA